MIHNQDELCVTQSSFSVWKQSKGCRDHSFAVLRTTHLAFFLHIMHTPKLQMRVRLERVGTFERRMQRSVLLVPRFPYVKTETSERTAQTKQAVLTVASGREVLFRKETAQSRFFQFFGCFTRLCTSLYC